MRDGHRDDTWNALVPALGIVVGSALLLVVVVVTSGAGSHLAYGVVGGATGGLLAALGLQVHRRRPNP